MLATVLAPGLRRRLVFGESVVHAHRRVKPRIGYMSQRFSLYPDLTVAENLEFFARSAACPPALRRDARRLAARIVGLTEFAGRQAQYLSGGMKQKLALAATLIHEPDLLFLDEPTTGVDPVSRREFWRIIADLHRRDDRPRGHALHGRGRALHRDRVHGRRPHPAPRHARRGQGARAGHAVRGRRAATRARRSRRSPAVDGVTSAHSTATSCACSRPPAGPTQTGCSATAARAGSHATAMLEPADVDMEAAFAFLAEQGGDAS